MQSSRLIVVSNRLPITFSDRNGKAVAVPSSGGLVGALEPLVREHHGLWIGSAGSIDLAEIRAQLNEVERQLSISLHPLLLTAEEQAKYYEGFSNEVLWPLFHDLPSKCVFDPDYWQFYCSVNQKFAAAIDEAAGPEDLIWVHDYQLMLVAHCLRRRRPHGFLSFFLHIPFPSPDIYGKLPWRREMLEALLDYDVIGVQTGRDARNLLSSLRRYLPHLRMTGKSENRVIHHARGVTTISALPISIDYADFDEGAKDPDVLARVRALREQSIGQKIALGIDRLDYTKGIPERIRAVRSFLRACPESRHKLTLIQVVVPSRENIPRYQELLSSLERLVSSVNGELAEPGWTPVQYLYRSIEKQELLALYRAADIALVTPLKDGMNLVAKEYCASHSNNDGVLILSEFAGAQPELRPGALVVNPFDELGIASAIRQAIEMSPAESRHRMLRMRQQIRRSDIHTWRDRAFRSMDAARQALS